MSNTETILYAVKDGEQDWQEVILTTHPDRIEDAKKWGKENGYGRFRIATIDLDERPDFTKTLN